MTCYGEESQEAGRAIIAILTLGEVNNSAMVNRRHVGVLHLIAKGVNCVLAVRVVICRAVAPAVCEQVSLKA